MSFRAEVLLAGQNPRFVMNRQIEAKALMKLRTPEFQQVLRPLL